MKQSEKETNNIILFFNRKFSRDDYFFNRIYFDNFDNENDIVKSLEFLKRFLILEGISGYLYIKNEMTTSYLKKQLKNREFICVDSIYTLESPPSDQNITTTKNLEKKISVTKINNDPILLNTWIRIFCQSFDIKDMEPYIEIVNKNKHRFVFLLANLKNKFKRKKKNKKHKESKEENNNNNNSYNADNDDNDEDDEKENDDIPAGVCLLFEKYGCLGLYCLGTLPTFRNRGIAQTILKTSLQVAYTMKYDKIFLQTFQNDNYIDFYKKFKFKVIDKRKIFQIN